MKNLIFWLILFNTYKASFNIIYLSTIVFHSNDYYNNFKHINLKILISHQVFLSLFGFDASLLQIGQTFLI